MKQHQLSAGKRLTKPILFGTLIVGLATAFFNRYDLSNVLYIFVALTFTWKCQIIQYLKLDKTVNLQGFMMHLGPRSINTCAI